MNAFSSQLAAGSAGELVTTALLLGASLALLIGLSLGLLGGGGSILTVPVLVYVLGLEPKRAIATSLLVVGGASAVGALAHARGGRVQWRTGLAFGLAGMAGAFAGGRLARFVPAPVLLLGFALIMLVTGMAMLRGRASLGSQASQPGARAASAPLPVGKVAALGGVVGLVTGLVGAGGGFVIVPALVLLGGLPVGAAVGTSLLVITMNSLAAFAGVAGAVPVEWRLGGLMAACAAAGSLLGDRLAGRLPQRTLRAAFGCFVIAMALLTLSQQRPLLSTVIQDRHGPA